MSRPSIAVALLLALWPAASLSQDKPGEKPAEAAKAPEPAKAGNTAKPDATPAPEDVGFAPLAGSWSGGGTLSISGGGRERMRCRAHHTVGQGGKSLSLSVRCASDSYRIVLSSNVVNRGGRIHGSWSEASYGASGSLSGSFSGERIRAVATGSSFSAGLSITTQGASQTISITPRGLPISGVYVSLRKN